MSILVTRFGCFWLDSFRISAAGYFVSTVILRSEEHGGKAARTLLVNCACFIVSTDTGEFPRTSALRGIQLAVQDAHLLHSVDLRTARRQGGERDAIRPGD